MIEFSAAFDSSVLEMSHALHLWLQTLLYALSLLWAVLLLKYEMQILFTVASVSIVDILLTSFRVVCVVILVWIMAV
jgi:hypothetical protein